MSELRTVEVFTGKQWEQKRLHEIRKGDLFRMFEPTGEQVFDPLTHKCEWFAADDGYINAEGTGTVAV